VVFFIKILLPLQHEELSYEGVWVKELSDNTGEINNLPVYTRKYKFADVIEFDPVTCKALRVVRDGGYTPAETIEYNGRFADEKAKWEAKGYVVEGVGEGKLGVARKYTEQRS
jgi:hypothetical protein